MARDYKHRATGRKRRKPVSPWLGVTVGLLVGLFVAFLIYIKMLAPKTPRLAGDITGGMPETTAAGESGTGTGTDNGNQPPKPRFVFYSELPEMEVIVPEEEIRAGATRPPPVVPDRQASTKHDRFKAKLALMGFETDIQTITINNKDTYHRVRVGPFSNLRTLDKARGRLKKQGIETRTVKIKG
jgi:hypothetical protein